MGHKIVYTGGIAEIVEKKSRFIASISPVNSEDEAAGFIEEIRRANRGASHNCSAIIVGVNNEFTRCSDDGEPSGTAGRPMLEVLLGQGIHNAAVVVTRYFGGTLLGTGGLVRAYQGAVKAGLEACVILEKNEGFRYELETDYNGLGKIQNVLENSGIFVLDTVYADIVKIAAMVPDDLENGFIKAVSDRTNGRAKLIKGEKIYYGTDGGKLILLEK